MAFTEFYVQTTGSNLNGGSSTGDNAKYTSTNGNWDGTSTFTPADTQAASLIAVGDFASVYNDGATVGVYIARVVTINSTGGNITSIVVSTTAKSGTAPTSSGTGRTIKVGGAWKGPNAAENFPFGFIAATATDTSGDYPRVNFKNGTNYSVTAAVAHSVAGPVIFQGYTGSAGDGGRAILDGGTSGTSYTLMSLTGTQCGMEDFIIQNNGASGSSNGFLVAGVGVIARRCVVNSVRGNGFFVNAASTLIECEAYSCSQSNTSTQAGITLGSNMALAIRCISHDNSGNGVEGFALGGGNVAMIDCISDTNGHAGINLTSGSAQNVSIIGCDVYNNVSHGIILSSGSVNYTALIENCNLIKNGTGGTGYGIFGNSTGSLAGYIINCGFGSGTQANTTGTTTALKEIQVSGSVTYASNVTPWIDPANGDFRINLAAAKNAGRGAFTETAASYAGTIGYPDIGSAQHLDAGGGLLINPGMSGGLR